jgi:virginiamycin A acetyltransferase
MKNGKKPDPNVIHPIAGYDKEIYVKPIVRIRILLSGVLPTLQTQNLKVM